jgi:aldehyde:ferredoxin oxidoreductase
MAAEKAFAVFQHQQFFPETRSSPLPRGYMGKILRVNLSDGRISEVNLPEEDVLRKWLGGHGLAQMILMHELPADVSPLDPANYLVFLTGPLTGTGKIPAGVVYSITTLSNITSSPNMNRGAIVSSTGAGYWGVYLKFSGYDGIIVTGAAKKPVYLWIENGRATLKEAGHLWGKDSHETEDLIKKELDRPEARVLTIGPAGENLAKAAMVLNDKYHSCAHGAGVIMGSKKLKAVAVYGSASVSIQDSEKLTEAGKRWRSKLTPWPLPEGRWDAGYGVTLGTIVYKNWQSTLFPEANKGFETHKFTARPCYRCNRACPYDAEMTAGKHAGYIATQGAGSEQHEALYTLGVGGTDVHYLADLLDRMGLEAGMFGCAAGVAFEAFEKGLLTARDTDGLNLRWGDSDTVEKLIFKVGRKEGWLASSIADGPKVTAAAIGEKAQHSVVHIKGGAPALHDWRPYLGQMLGQITSCGGGKPRFQGFEVRGDPSLGYPEKTQAVREGKAAEVIRGGAYRLLCGNAGVCWFGTRGKIFEDMVEAIGDTTGWHDFSPQEALIAGERTWQLEHIFHLRFGWTPVEDYQNVGPRFLEPIPDGRFKGFTISHFLPDILTDFYKECGWDTRTGKPLLSTLKKYGLEDFSFMSAEADSP